DPGPPQEDHGSGSPSKEELHVAAGSYRVSSRPASEPGTGTPRRNPPADAQRRPDPRHQAAKAQDQRRNPTARTPTLAIPSKVRGRRVASASISARREVSRLHGHRASFDPLAARAPGNLVQGIKRLASPERAPEGCVSKGALTAMVAAEDEDARRAVPWAAVPLKRGASGARSDVPEQRQEQVGSIVGPG